MINNPQITLRPVEEEDLEFLFRLYASTRTAEKHLVGWPDAEWDQFMRMQFTLQHSQYMRNYKNPAFNIILENGVSAGRFYVDRGDNDYRLVDVALLPEFQRRGIAGNLLDSLLWEAETNGLPVSLHVEKNNPILDYYRRLGFRVEEDKGVYYFMVRPPGGKRPDGLTVDTIPDSGGKHDKFQESRFRTTYNLNI